MSKYTRALIFIGSGIIFLLALRYTARIQYITGMGDMRGRVVGARLIKDGRLPYYYSWYPGDTMRYFGGSIVDSPRRVGVISNLTAPPSILRPMTLFADSDEYKIDWGAFVLFHAFFLVSVLLALRYTQRRRWPQVLLLLLPVMLTDGWIYHFFTSQYYILFGFMLMLVSLLLLRRKEMAAGALFALLFLFRFNTVVFSFPFLLLGWRYRRFFAAGTACVLAYGLFVLASPFEQKLWKEYFAALKDHQDVHMGVAPAHPEPLGHIYPLTVLPEEFEGQNYHKLDSLFRKEHIRINFESSNFKMGYEAITGHYPSVIMLQVLLLAAMLLTLLALRLGSGVRKIRDIPPHKLVITGLFFYFLTNFFSTIATVPYHLPQWLAAGVIFAIYAQRLPRVVPVLFMLGMVANFYILPGFRGKHLLGEMILLLSAFWAIAAPGRNPDAGPQATVAGK